MTVRYSMDGFTGDEFVGYAFVGEPPRVPRLWFLERHIERCLEMVTDIAIRGGEGGWRNTNGVWTAEPDVAAYPEDHIPGLLLRYEHRGNLIYDLNSTDTDWTAVWRIMGTRIEGVHTFGRDDDVWRLGLWPD